MDVIVIPWGVKVHIIHSLYLALTCNERSPFFLSCHRKFHMNWTSFKRSPVLKEHFFPYPNGKLLTPGLTVSQLLSFTDVTVRAVWRNPIVGHKCGFFRSPTAWHVNKLEQVEIWFYSDCIHKKVKLSSKLIATY